MFRFEIYRETGKKLIKLEILNENRIFMRKRWKKNDDNCNNWLQDWPRYKLISGTFRSIFRMYHEEHVWKSSAKVSSVVVMMPRAFGRVNVHAFGTIALDHRLAGYVAQSERQHRLWLAIDAGTMTEIARLIFFNHLSNSSVGQDVTRVDQTVEHLGCLFYQIRLVWIVIQIIVCVTSSFLPINLYIFIHFSISSRSILILLVRGFFFTLFLNFTCAIWDENFVNQQGILIINS